MALLDQLLVEDTLALAWARVRRDGGGAGVDGIGLDEFGRNALLRLGRLRDQVRDGRYRPAPLLRLELPRPGGEPRPLAVPTAGERVLQTAATLMLGPILDRIAAARMPFCASPRRAPISRPSPACCPRPGRSPDAAGNRRAIR